MTLNELASVCHLEAIEGGWWNNFPSMDERIAGKFALIHSEVSEALEAYRKDAQDEHLPHRKGVEVELADAVIRIVDLAGALDLDLDAAILEKRLYNKERLDHKPEARSNAGGKRF